MTEAELRARIRAELAWPLRLLKAAAFMGALWLLLSAIEMLWP